MSGPRVRLPAAGVRRVVTSGAQKRNPCIRTNEESWCTYSSGRSVLRLSLQHTGSYFKRGGV
jgi:hypothetical protein